MTRLLRLNVLALLAATLAAMPACSTDETDASCDDGQCDDADTPLKTPCDSVLVDKSGRGFLPATLKDDPLIKLVYSTDGGCPLSARDIIEKLKKTDNRDCGSEDGLATRVISEQAQLSGTAAGSAYRMITSKQCNNREEFELLFSMFGFSDTAGGKAAGLNTAGTNLPPTGVEIVAFDPSDGVFNYYKEVGGKMGFFGTSRDFVTQGPGGPNLTSTRGCANCHTGGGLIMKELEAPWLHWEGSTTTPGVRELIQNREELLGVQSNGIELEGIVRAGNAKWNETRIKLLKETGTVADLLRPLFCPVEINLAEGSESDVASSFLVDTRVGFVSVTNDSADYEKLLTAIDSTIDGTDKRDTFFPFAFIDRSGADQDYIDQLVTKKIINDQFAQDVLMVDFTRPVFSDDRCDLLAEAPTLAPKDRTVAKIRAGFIKNLQGAAAGSPAAQLLAHLQATAAKKAIDHSTTISAFETLCQARADGEKISIGAAGEVSAFLADVFKLRSLWRKLAFEDGEIDNEAGSAQRLLKVFEFPDTMPSDAIRPVRSAKPAELMQVHPDARLSPVDCKLTNAYVAPPAAEGN